MRSIIAVAVVLCAFCALSPAQDKAAKPPATLRSILLEQLKTTHNAKDWFVDGNTAISGLTPEQASWSDGKGNHSVGQLTYHMVFWNQQVLDKLRGQTPAKFEGNNDVTFTIFDAKKWSDLQQQFDQVMKDLEKWVETADDAKVEKAASTIAHVGAHNAYHIGEIVYVRREQGSWDPEKGVK